MDAGLRTIVDVIARLRGRDEPDRVVLLGTHHDAWTFGGVDPGGSGAVILELARALSARSARGLAAAAHDRLRVLGRERSSGSSARPSTPRRRRPSCASGPSPTSTRDLYLAGRFAREDRRPSQDFARAGVRRRARSGHGPARPAGSRHRELQPLGSGADFVAFQDYLGLPTLSLELGDFTNYGAYHSSHDTRQYMKTHGDPGWRHGVALAELLGRTVMRLASAESVPVRPSREADAILRWLDRLAGARAGLDLEGLERLRRELRSLAESAASSRRSSTAALAEGGSAVARAGEGGDRLLASLKAFVDESDPQFYRHPIYGWDIHALYGGDTLPGLGRALREGRGDLLRAAAARSRRGSGPDRPRRPLAASSPNPKGSREA